MHMEKLECKAEGESGGSVVKELAEPNREVRYFRTEIETDVADRPKHKITVKPGIDQEELR